MTAIVLAVPAVELPREGRRSYAPQILLAAGWVGLFAYCATYLTEDMPFRNSAPLAVGEPLFDQPEDLPRRALAMAKSEEPAPAAASVAAPAAASAVEAAPASAPAAQPVVPASAPRPAAEYVGTWGPTAEACGAPSRRQGYLPAMITPERARAGATLCTFHDTHRSGNAWTMAADCADRDRRWSSRVRLVVEGDRLTWSSAWGRSDYIRCGRRAG
ncbi:peptidase inhibitor family I36 protein [Methylobacterium sp. J-030]|uniref:peptidase inhibitor family I36 protein n=1 Tax=Methylobacterium sp. J-030 TaxID=2836627 RepID=UPI001FBB306E|nr:peptidase inhibitor family I36 protein [Methylobacterium sp. J-030]MCJ2072022.1 peptidase inhibitor family I36 protein [Methylobacterium sp. J-030]